MDCIFIDRVITHTCTHAIHTDAIHKYTNTCTFRKKEKLVEIKKQTTFRDKTEGSEQELEVEDIVYHKGYSDLSLNNDIAIIKLKEEVKLNDDVGVACLPKELPLSNSTCYLTG